MKTPIPGREELRWDQNRRIWVKVIQHAIQSSDS
jgi:hypothetical protein